MSDLNTPPSTPVNTSRNLVLVGGGLALAGLGLAAGLFLRSPTTGTPVSADSQASSPVGMSGSASASTSATDSAAAVEHPASNKVVHHKEPSRAVSSERDSVKSQRAEALPVAACDNCGVIESVQAVQQKGQGTGLGAVTGGVLGGVVGNQMGKGDGKAAMTILGALGGGLAGNEVEKRQRSETVYEVRVRMNDGGTRTFMQKTEPVAGTRVVVEGDTFRAQGN